MIESWLIELAQSGGAVIVNAVATDAWQAVRAGVARLFGTEDEKQQAVVLRRLDATAQDVVAAPAEDDQAVREQEITAWQTRLADLLAERPAAADELRLLLDELREQGVIVSGPVIGRTGPIVQTNTGGISVANSGVVSGDVNLR
jgi:hypothetical protein